MEEQAERIGGKERKSVCSAYFPTREMENRFPETSANFYTVSLPTR
jgi:hypothetical protein